MIKRDERDTRDTAYRRGIQDLYKCCGIVPAAQGFACPAFQGECSAHGTIPLHTGNWAFVGCEYGTARINGLPIRILFVAMDRGGKGESVHEEFADTQLSFRRSIEYPQNAHMGVVRIILTNLADEKNPTVLAGQCALTNAVKCVKQTGMMSNTDPTPVMIRRCADHLQKEVAVLQPHVIVTQGGHPETTIARLMTPIQEVAVFLGPKQGHTIPTAKVSVARDAVLLTMPHSRVKGLEWSKGNAPKFFLDAIRRTRAEITAILKAKAEPQCRA